MDLSSAFSGLKGGSPQERKEAIKQQVASELAMSNVSGLAGRGMVESSNC